MEIGESLPRLGACLLVHGLLNNEVIKWCTERYVTIHVIGSACLIFQSAGFKYTHQLRIGRQVLCNRLLRSKRRCQGLQDK